MPTNTLEAAQDVLSAIITDGGRFAALSFLKPHHFTEPLHRRIFEISADMAARGEPVSFGIIRSALQGDKALADMDRAAGGDYLKSLWNSGCSPQYAEEMARLLADDWMRAQILQAAHDVTLYACGAVPHPALDVLDFWRKRMDGLACDIPASGRVIRPITEIADEVIAELTEMLTTGRSPGRRCGLYCVDNRMGGMMPGELVVLAGRPSMGKTGLARAIAHGFAVHNPDMQAAFFGLEMGAKEIGYRALSAVTRDLGHGVEYREMVEGPLHPDDRAAVDRARARLPGNLMLIDSPGLGLDDLCRRVWDLKRKGPLGLVVIDYLQLMRRPDIRGRNEASLIGDITQGLKRLARQADCTILLLSQLSRQVESREDKRPQLSDLRESGHIEQDADFVLFAYREAYYRERSRPRNAGADYDLHTSLIDRRMEVIMAKARRAQIGTDLHAYYAEYDHISDWSA
ncbi:replicative DNA helicase [Asticcacaulis solisilvae]|uniref:replicative DNA helicase n=1 Tax=Asticcacaulis solisilvae TaxID=1217274 RepID=UPI003FD70DD4